MSAIKSSLNSLISKLVTRKRVLKATKVEEIDFDAMLMQYFETKQKSPEDNYYDGVDAFIRDFLKEGWCKEEYRDIFDTLFHLNREISEYGTYWF